MDLRWSFFCGEQRKTFFEVEPHLVAEYRPCAGAGAVAFVGAVVEDMTEQVKILFHLCDG